jgi:hypothetical protein
MPLRTSLLSSTMLSGIVGVTFLGTLNVSAAELYAKGPYASTAVPFTAPAVDGFNGKIEAFGGSTASRGLVGASGAFSIPLGNRWGLQFDATAGSYDSLFFGGIGAHLFWRDPSVGMLGLYASHTYWDKFSGLRASHIAVEGEYYMGQWTIQGIAGFETGNSASAVVGPFIQTYDVQTRFFDKINLAYYLQPDFKLFVGHRYLGGRHAAALGGEYAFPLGGGRMASLFAEGRIGDGDYRGIWGGLKVYFGQRDKSLVQRHRQDDPIIWMPMTLFSIINSLTTTPVTPPECCIVDPDTDSNT